MHPLAALPSSEVAISLARFGVVVAYLVAAFFVITLSFIAVFALKMERRRLRARCPQCGSRVGFRVDAYLDPVTASDEMSVTLVCRNKECGAHSVPHSEPIGFGGFFWAKLVLPKERIHEGPNPERGERVRCFVVPRSPDPGSSEPRASSAGHTAAHSDPQAVVH